MPLSVSLSLPLTTFSLALFIAKLKKKAVYTSPHLSASSSQIIWNCSLKDYCKFLVTHLMVSAHSSWAFCRFPHLSSVLALVFRVSSSSTSNTPFPTSDPSVSLFHSLRLWLYVNLAPRDSSLLKNSNRMGYSDGFEMSMSSSILSFL